MTIYLTLVTTHGRTRNIEAIFDGLLLIHVRHSCAGGSLVTIKARGMGCHFERSEKPRLFRHNTGSDQTRFLAALPGNDEVPHCIRDDKLRFLPVTLARANFIAKGQDTFVLIDY